MLESGKRAVCKFTVWRNCEFRPLFHTSRTFIAPTHPIHRCTKEEHRESGRKLVCVETTVTLLIFNFNFKLAAEFDLSLVKSSQNGNYCRLRHALLTLRVSCCVTSCPKCCLIGSVNWKLTKNMLSQFINRDLGGYLWVTDISMQVWWTVHESYGYGQLI